jgi:xylose isomerase
MPTGVAQTGWDTDQFLTNYAWLLAYQPTHSCLHLRVRVALSSYASLGDAQTGWDTDQFLTDPRMATLVMAAVIKNNGLGTGGINFDAKIR